MKKEVEEEEKMKEEIFEQMKELVEDEIKQDCMVELEKKDKEMENRIMRMKIKLEDIVVII